MPTGFPHYSQNRFPNEKPPTLMHPASPNSKSAKPAKDDDNMSIASTSTFSSTVGLIKSKLPISYKDYKARKESEARKKGSKIQADGKSPRARTAEAYAIIAATK